MTRVAIAAFEDHYRRDPDPWRFATSDYEQRRYDMTIAALPRPRYRRAFEPGCAIGELTARLAERCGSVIAWDGAPTVVDHARRRLASHTNVRVRVGLVPGRWPEETFDLVVLSEIGYYFDASELARLALRATTSLEPHGTLMAVHWMGHSEDHLLHGDEVHEILAVQPGLAHGGGYRDDGFRLDWWTRQ